MRQVNQAATPSTMNQFCDCTSIGRLRKTKDLAVNHMLFINDREGASIAHNIKSAIDTLKQLFAKLLINFSSS